MRPSHMNYCILGGLFARNMHQNIHEYHNISLLKSSICLFNLVQYSSVGIVLGVIH